jgi:hypothetical protein
VAVIFTILFEESAQRVKVSNFEENTRQLSLFFKLNAHLHKLCGVDSSLVQVLDEHCAALKEEALVDVGLAQHL